MPSFGVVSPVHSGHGVTGARGLAIGQVYAADGVHLASVVQEALIREKTR